MQSVKDHLDGLVQKQHHLAIFYELVRFLDEELADHDMREPTRTVAATRCVEPAVGTEAVEDVRVMLMEKFVGPLEEEVEKALSATVKP